MLPQLQAGVDKAGPLTGTGDDGHTDSTINGALVVLAARFAGTAAYQDKVATVVRALCNTERCLSNSRALATALEGAILGKPLAAVLSSTFPSSLASAPEASRLASDALAAAASGIQGIGSLKDVAAKFGPACDVKHTTPLAAFCARYTPAGGEGMPDFKTAVRTNVSLSGDTCGRAPIVGALAAAGEAPGAAALWADWAATLLHGKLIAQLAASLATAAEETASTA